MGSDENTGSIIMKEIWQTLSVPSRNQRGCSCRMFMGVDCIQKRRWLEKDLRRPSSAFLLPL